MSSRVMRILLLSLFVAVTWTVEQAPTAQEASKNSALHRPSAYEATLVFEQPNNLWFTGPLVRAGVSQDGKWALFSAGLANVHLFSLPAGNAEPGKLRDGLDRVYRAEFCGPNILRWGVRGADRGLFFRGPRGPVLSQMQPIASAACTPDGDKIAFYKSNAPNSVYVGTLANYREFPVQGNISSLAFSPDGGILYVVSFQANGKSV